VDRRQGMDPGHAVLPVLRPLESKPNQADLRLLKELLETGRVTPVIDRTYPLSKVPEAIRYLHAGRARGKVVITV
jgi:NADPH:quinone reductase-like Zn-dependent oxidoreductase